MLQKRKKEKKKQTIDLQDLNQTNPITNIPYSQRYYSILKQRKKLPAWEARDQLLMLLKQHQILILEGETGSGKTTQIPQFLIDAGYAE